MSTPTVGNKNKQMSLMGYFKPKEKEANTGSSHNSTPGKEVNNCNTPSHETIVPIETINSAKKRTPPSTERPKNKKLHQQIYEERDTEKEETMEPELEQNNQQPQISSSKSITSFEEDNHFDKFSEEFREFGKAICEKMQEIVHNNENTLQELIRPLKEDIKSLLDTNEKHLDTSTVVIKVQEEQKEIQSKFNQMESENKELKRRLVKLENKMLEKNVIMHGIREDTWELAENRKDKVHKAISATVDETDSRKKLKIARSIPIASTKRIGRYRSGACRPISISFEKQTHVETLFENKEHLPSGVYIDREYTEETEKARKLLRPILQLAKTIPEYKGKSKIEGDTLVIRGKKYTTDNLHNLPENINGYRASTKSDANTFAFFGELNPFSNYHTAHFSLDNKHYHCTEQYIQEQKALYFKDKITALEIMNAKSALECKKLSMNITRYSPDSWTAIAKDLCRPGITAKISSSEDLINLLLETGNRQITEATYDQLWGSGVPLRSKDCLKPECWKGIGIMGEILMEIRDYYSRRQMDTTATHDSANT